MAESVDYFSNHRLKLRFPWRLYHGPIVQALRTAVADAPGPNVLNVGAGPFFELGEVGSAGRRFTICDIDSRAIELAKTIHGEKLAGTDVIGPNGLPYQDSQFDLVVSMDVIEHTLEPEPWLLELVRVLRPGGHLFLTTPNYGSTSLRFLEATALEIVARTQGFSRKHLHPSKLTADKLLRILRASGLKKSQVQRVAFGWVLVAHGEKAGASAHLQPGLNS